MHLMDRAVAIANEFLAKAGAKGLSQMQIQKLVYFAHGWTLAVTGKPLTSDEPQAWLYGPVYSDLYDHTKFFGKEPINRLLTPDDDDALRFFIPELAHQKPYKAELSETESDIIDRVWRRYGHISGGRLSALTHQPGTPWSETYNRGAGKNRTIVNELIEKHFLDIAARAEQTA